MDYRITAAVFELVPSLICTRHHRKSLFSRDLLCYSDISLVFYSTGMATAPQLSLHMRSADFIRKEPLDHGGFGDVYLCLHVALGPVVMKTVYTGTLRNE